MDGIVYGVVVSLGFATYENYDYVFRLAEIWEIDPAQLAIWRSYSAVPMHGLNGCIMGFYFGMYAFSANKRYLFLSLLVPFLLHGFYNFFGYPINLIIVLGMLALAIVLHTKLKKLQVIKKTEKERLRIEMTLTGFEIFGNSDSTELSGSTSLHWYKPFSFFGILYISRMPSPYLNLNFANK